MILNQIKEMQQQGMSDADIIQRLREQGVSQMDIHQSLEQSKIKAAVDEDENANILSGQMQPSVMQEEEQEEQEYAPQQYSQQQYAPQQQYYQPPQENFSEIAEQIAEEKLNTFRKKIGNIDELKIMTGKRIDNIDDRLKKIEEVIDLLQKAIINKIGSFGDNIEQIKEEMGMMQESFSKALPNMPKDKKRRSDGFEHYLRR